MTGLFHPPFNDEALIISYVQDPFGDYTVGSSFTSKCHIRDSRYVRRGTLGEEYTVDGTIWFPVGTDVTVGDIISYGGRTFQLDSYVGAKGLMTTIQFLKFDLILRETLVS